MQVYGDTAILTYNFAGLRRGADGKVNPSLAKSTRVYVKQGGQWKLVTPTSLRWQPGTNPQRNRAASMPARSLTAPSPASCAGV